MIAAAPDPFTGGETEAVSMMSAAVRQKSWVQFWGLQGRGFTPSCSDGEQYPPPPAAGARAAPCPLHAALHRMQGDAAAVPHSQRGSRVCKPSRQDVCKTAIHPL